MSKTTIPTAGLADDAVNLTSKVTGTLPVANGGTAITSGFQNGVDPRPNAIPLIVNGDMAISQRNTSVTGIGNGDEGYHTIDRFKFEEGSSPAAVWTMTQESLTSGNAYTAGFTKALKMDVTTSDDLSNSGDILNVLKYATERQDTHLFKKGTANAEKYTVAFWIKATKTGTHICELRDSTNDRAVSVAYTVSTTNTWEHKVLNFPADTTGAIGTGNSKGLEIYWCLHHGGNYGNGAALQTAWAGSATNKRYKGQVNNADSTSNNWHLTGVQLEVGEYTSSTLPPFQFETFGDNLARCQRYYYKHVDRRVSVGQSDNDMIIGKGGFNAAGQFEATVHFKATMRVAPSLVIGNGNNYFKLYVSGTTHTFDDFQIHADGNNACSLYKSGFSGIQGEAGNLVVNNANAYVHFNSEL